jgi:hypothetical protein
LTETFTYAKTFTYTRSELLTDLIVGTFDRVLEQLSAPDRIPASALEEVLGRGWLADISVVASTGRPDGTEDWHLALRAEIDAKTHLARLAVASKRDITLPEGRADDIADQLAYYAQMFVKLVKRHSQDDWRYGFWWGRTALGREHTQEFDEITGARTVYVNHASPERVGQFSPEEIDEATFGIEVFTDEA